MRDRGLHHRGPQVYGRSWRGIPLEVWKPESGSVDVLWVAGIHGEEPETTVVLSRAMRSLQRAPERAAVILAANPDGLFWGTRGNGRGVDLNRNFPAENWRPDPVTYCWLTGETSEIALSSGDAPASEPETRALLELSAELRPQVVIVLHAPLACIDDPGLSTMGRWLAERTGMPLVREIGYPTPGSWGSWAMENGLSLITYELPAASIEELVRDHVPVIARALGEGLPDCADELEF